MKVEGIECVQDAHGTVAEPYKPGSEPLGVIKDRKFLSCCHSEDKLCRMELDKVGRKEVCSYNVFSTSALDGNALTHFSHFTPVERVAGTHQIGN
jgi:hypothetical protein